MRKCKFYFIASFFMSLVISLLSCSKDDEGNNKHENTYDESLLVGNWVLTHVIYEDDEEYEEDHYSTSEEYDIINFQEDGYCRNFCDSWDDSGRWKLSGDALTLFYYGEGRRTVTITELSSSVLSFEDHGIFSDGSMEYTYIMTYRKVKSVSTPVDPDKPVDPDDPDTPDDPITPDVPNIPSATIKSKIYEVYEDKIIVDFTLDKEYISKMRQMGYCWSTKPNPTVFDSTEGSTLNPNKESGRVTCELKEAAGTTYYIRAYALVGSEFVYFDEMKVQSVGRDIKLSAYYSKDKDKIAVDYNITRNDVFTLYFYAPLTSGFGRVVNDDLGILGKEKGTKYVINYSCYYYYAYLEDVLTGIRYCSNIVYKHE